MATADQIARLRRAKSWGWFGAWLFFAGKPALLCERILVAMEQQKDRLLHDPIEDDPAYSSQVEDARRRSTAFLRDRIAKRNDAYRRRGKNQWVRENPPGGCHIAWREMKRILKEQHGIEWFSLAEMNPCSRFD